jgi:hypothetical protein
MQLTSFAAFSLLLAFLQTPAPPPQQATVSPQAFVGTWVGTQSWAIENPPPGARQDQPVTLTIDIVDGKIIGSLIPFMGGQDGATFVEGQIVGDELRASAVVGRPRAGAARDGAANGADAGAAAGRGRGRRGAPNWKDPIKIQFAFKNDGVTLSGLADVTMNDVKWLKFKYDLSRKRSRY